MNESYGVMEGQLPDRSIYRGYQASAQTSLAVRPTIGTERNDAPHVLSLILRIVSVGILESKQKTEVQALAVSLDTHLVLTDAK